MPRLLALLLLLCLPIAIKAQWWNDVTHLTHADTVKGANTAERSWWDVQRYDLCIEPDIKQHILQGVNTISFRVNRASVQTLMQLDLQAPLHVDSAVFNRLRVPVRPSGNAWYLQLPPLDGDQLYSIRIYYSGSPRVSVQPPWDGGWVWGEDSLHRPWTAVACQGAGASTWYPCKEWQGDEPDQGTSISITVPDTLVAVANGRLQYVEPHGHSKAYHWAVQHTINNYAICPYIGKYVAVTDTCGPLDISAWVLDYNRGKAVTYLIPQAKEMLRSFQRWFGPYPFPEDGYKLVDAPGFNMEHQSAIAYNNGYAYGNRGVDYTGTGWALTFDFAIVHESAHEWFGNSITAIDPADKWIHEAFAAYADALYLDDHAGMAAGNAYVIAFRDMVHNDRPVTGPYNVAKEGGPDMYPKGRNMLHMIRQVINDDARFRELLLEINTRFAYQDITGGQLEAFISHFMGMDLSRFFEQYLCTTQIPVLEYHIRDGVCYYRFAECVTGFTIPVKVKLGREKWITPTTAWQQLHVPENVSRLVLDPNFYLHVTRLQK